MEHFIVNAVPGRPLLLLLIDGIALTINPTLYVSPETMTSSCCTCHLTPYMKHYLWIVVPSSPSRLNGQMYATSTFRKILEKSSTNSILICFSLRLDWKHSSQQTLCLVSEHVGFTPSTQLLFLFLKNLKVATKLDLESAKLITPFNRLLFGITSATSSTEWQRSLETSKKWSA